MPWSVEELHRWLDEVEPRMDTVDLFAWLDLTPSATPADIQPAFHAVARTRHPDLFRTRLDAAAMDRLVRVYARIAAAYAELRDPERCEEVARSLRRPPTGSTAPPSRAARPAAGSVQGPRTPSPPPAQVSRTRTPAPTSPSPAPDAAAVEPARAMNARALTHYRRAEGALRVGDRMAALLHLRMAMAADPSSAFLRAALQELHELTGRR